MMLDELSRKLRNAINKFKRRADKKAIEELNRDIQRALFEADVNVELVLELTNRIEEEAFKVKPPPGLTIEKYIIKIVYDELTNFLGKTAFNLKIIPSKTNIILMVGIQGSGKTTSTAKLARYLQKRGRKVGIVCADTWRPGAYDQLKQLAEQNQISFYGEKDNKDSIKIAMNGVKQFIKEKKEIIIVDTAGRHKEEKGLMNEMKQIALKVNPTEIILVIDGTLGQQSAAQAYAFNKVTDVGSILVTKLDGSAKGGGALSAVTATGAPIKFVGTGEKSEDLEKFDPKSFVGRLLGVPDIKSLLEQIKVAEIAPQKDAQQKFLSGKFTLKDMYEQLKSITKKSFTQKIIDAIGMGPQIPPEMKEMAMKNIDVWKYILDSMTEYELENPKKINRSRLIRIARGSGKPEGEVKQLLNQFDMMRGMFKRFGKDRRFRKGGGMPPGFPGFPPGAVGGKGLPKKFKYKGVR
ncbi:MAG: signal recognition particle protein [Candidatus Helarchaeota archaeon]|nr:signal recognition particle protein [Candidatus Helarchaeota archaeon]